MKRYSPEHVNDTAKRFAVTSYAKMWNLFSGEIRRALVDAHVMDELRIADSADSEISLTATEIVKFRDAVAARLAEGVRAHNRAMKCAFKIEG